MKSVKDLYFQRPGKATAQHSHIVTCNTLTRVQSKKYGHASLGMFAMSISSLKHLKLHLQAIIILQEKQKTEAKQPRNCMIPFADILCASLLASAYFKCYVWYHGTISCMLGRSVGVTNTWKRAVIIKVKQILATSCLQLAQNKQKLFLKSI